MRNHYFPVMAVAGVFALGAVLSASPSALAGENRVSDLRCDSVEVSIGNAKDASALFKALPADSERVGDSAVVRSTVMDSDHDELSIRCAVSSGNRASCKVRYSQFSATSDTCSLPRQRFSMTGFLSQQVVSELSLAEEMTNFGPMKTYQTRDGVLSLDCGTVMSGTECSLVVR